MFRKIDFDVGEREIVAIVGANGAGKTTLMRAIMGGLAPSRGAIRFLGQTISGAPPHRIAAAGIRLVPEGRRVFAGLTVDVAGRLYGFNSAEQKAVRHGWAEVGIKVSR